MMLKPSLASSIIILMVSQSNLHSALCNLLIHAHLCLKVPSDEFSIAEWDLVLMVPFK